MKYMGSKARFAKELYAKICEITPRAGRPWVEPFAGGMNMLSAIPPIDGPRYANDSNRYLIAMFKALVSGWIPPRSITRDFYEKCKNLQESDHVIGYVGFNCSYSGKWFGGYAGSVRTAAGTLRDYQDEAFRHMERQVTKLNDVLFCNAAYSAITLPQNAVVYCDPPYAGTTGYKDNFDHAAFWAWVRGVSKEHDVFVSEYSAPADFECLHQIDACSSLSANGSVGGSKSSTEKLFSFRNRNGNT